MMSFPTVVTWGDVALRLCCTLAAGLLIGWNRDETGRPAGLRTTVLVTLAASVAMIEANLLLPTEGKASGSFANIDVMRLPLGILSTDEALSIDEVMKLLKSANLHVTSHAQGYKCGTVSKVSLDLNWRSPLGDVAPPAVIDTISKLPGVKLARWTPKGMSP